MQNNVIELIKNKNIKELINLIQKNPDINLNVKDENFNYFIYYIVSYNQEDLIDLVLSRNIRLDILDTDGRNILYIPIKFGYNKLLSKILEKDKSNIGIPIIDLKDKLGLTAIHYAIIFNNFEAFKLLLKKSNLLLKNNQNLNSFHICIQYNRINFFIELLNEIPELFFATNNNENLLQYAIVYDRIDFVSLILSKKINVNNQESVNGLSALHQIIIKRNNNIVDNLIKYGADINLQDYYGNTSLHYAISEDNKEIINLLIKYSPNFNLTNIDGNTPLHIYLQQSYLEKDVLSVLIEKTDLNVQNNQGETCLKKIIELYITDNYKNILRKKELNFFILDNNNEDISNSLDDREILDLAVDSFYNLIKEKKEELILDWEIWCSNDLIEKLKTLKINKSEPEGICKEKIKQVILDEKRSLPKFSNYNLILDNGIFVNNSLFYTGVPLDIVFGLIHLYQSFSKNGLQLILDYPLSINQPLETYYQKLGIDYPFKLEFSNCEILWSFQKIFYPSYFDDEFEKIIRDKSSKYIVIPLGIELTNGSHANIIFIDLEKKTIERFEPNGSNQPMGLNYNPELLDELLENKFHEYNLKYYRPKDYLPSIGFQILENLEETKYRKIGDPNGFCGVWCIWWVYHRMKNRNILNKDLVVNLIKNIKMENKSFRNMIRNFSYYVTELRDKSLKKYNIDINDWMVSALNQEIINNLEKDIIKLIR